MKNIRKLLSIFLIAVCIASSMTALASEEAYDELSFKKVCSFDGISEAGKRLNTISKYNVGEKCFAVAGLWSASKTDFFVLDITNPLNIEKIQDLSDSYTKMIPDSGMVYALNASSNTIDVYKTDENGCIDISNKISEAAIGRAANINEMKVIDGRYVFVSQRSANEAMMVFDAKDNMNKILSLSSIKPGTSSPVGVMTSAFDVLNISDGKYRLFSYNRCFYDEKHNYELSITDIDLNNKSYDILYWGIPEGYSNVSNAQLKSIKILNNNTIILLYSDKSCAAEIIDISNAEAPVKKAEITDMGSGSTVKKLSDTCFIIGSDNNPLCAYKYEDETLSAVSDRISTAGQVYDAVFYDGYIIIANNSVINVVSYMYGLNVEENQVVPSFEPYVSGTVSGYVPEADRVTVTVNDKEYDAVMQGNAFYAEIENAEYDNPNNATVSLYREGTLVCTAECTVTVEKKNKIVFIDPVHNYDDNGSYTFTAQICNQSKKTINKCTIYAAVYNKDRMSDYDYRVTENLSGGASENISLNVRYNKDNDKYIKIFVVESEKNNAVLSEVLIYPNDSELTDYSELIKEDFETDKKAALEYEFNYENENVVFNMLSEKNNEPGVLTVYKGEANLSEDNVEFIDVINLNSSGRAAIRYAFNGDAVNFDKFNVTFAVGKDTDNAIITFVGNDLVKAFFEDVKSSTVDTIYSVLTSEEYNRILNVDFEGEYSSLSDAGKKEVLGAICGKEFSTLKSVEDTFNNAVAGVSAAEKIAAESEADKVMALIDAYIQNNILEESEMYRNIMSESMKKSFISDKIIGKNILNINTINNILQNDSKIFYLNNLTAGAIVDEKVIETHGETLGIDKKDIDTYASSKYKLNIIKEFIKNEFTDAESIKTKFSSALKNANKSTDSGNGGGSSSGSSGSSSGGGRQAPVLPATKIETVDPAEIKETTGNSSTGNSSTDISSASAFADVSNDAWYSNAVNYLVSKGYAEGISNTAFAPEQNIKREEFVKMIISAFRLEDGTAETSFNDTDKNMWHYLYIASANKYHIVNGESDKVFGVGMDITREDMATILSRVINFRSIVLEENDASEFTDKNSISAYALDNVVKMRRMNVINGFEDGTFRPKEYATRAMAAQMIYNILERTSK